MTLPPDLAGKRDRLLEILRSLGKCAGAVSGDPYTKGWCAFRRIGRLARMPSNKAGHQPAAMAARTGE